MLAPEIPPPNRVLYRAITKKKVDSPLKKNAKRTPTSHFMTELSKQSLVLQPYAINRRSILRPKTELASSAGVLCGDGMFDYETDVRVEIFEYMRNKELETKANAANIGQQPEIRWEMRPILVDFLVQVHQHYKLRQESLHLAINVLDRYMSKAIVLKKHYQLVGMTCMWLAAKYEDGQDNVPKASLLCYLCCNLYDEKAFVTMEKHILKTMDWSLGHPTAEAFLQKALSELMNDDRRTQHVARFLLELTLFHACFISYGSYVVGTSCLYFARYILGISQKALAEDDLRLNCIHLLDCSLANVSRVVHTKYSDPKYSRASIIVKNWADNGHHFYQPSHEELQVDDSYLRINNLPSDLWDRNPPSPAIVLSLSPPYSEHMQPLEREPEDPPLSVTKENYLPVENMPDGYQQFANPQKLPPLPRPRAGQGLKILGPNHRWSENAN